MQHNGIPLKDLGLTQNQINTIKDTYPQLEQLFSDTYKLPTQLIKDGLNGYETNTDYLLQIYNTHNIKPETLFNYGSDVFTYANKNATEDEQTEIIASADTQLTSNSIQETKNELQELKTTLPTDTYFKFLSQQYQQKATNLKNLQYKTKPEIGEIWKLNLVNAKNITVKDDADEIPITVEVEQFLIDSDEINKSFTDSPALVSIVGNYEEYSRISKGDILIVTPNAFRDGTRLTTANSQ